GRKLTHLAYYGGLGQAVAVGPWSELAGQQRDGRPEALPAGGVQVQGDLGEELLPRLQPPHEELLDVHEVVTQSGGEGRVTDIDTRHGVVGCRMGGAGRH